MKKRIAISIWLLLFVNLVFAEKPIGTNLEVVSNYNGQLVFVDIFKHAGTWVTGYATGETTYNFGWGIGGSVPLGSNGYPLEMPYNGVGVSTPTILQTIMFYQTGGHYHAGTYTVMYEGTGRILVSGDTPWRVFSSSGTYQITVTPGSTGICVRILESSASNPVSNIRIIMPGHESTYQTNPFYPTFTDRLRGFKAIRFMPWCLRSWNLNDTSVTDWNERITTSYYTQTTSTGVALEYMIALCNEVDADAWINIPHKAGDSYVTQCARLWRDNLEAGRKIFIEYSNEVWNGAYAQEVYCRQQGLALNLDTDPSVARDKFYTKRSLEIFRIFETEFGGSTRLCKVIATQAANQWVTGNRLNALNNVTVNPYGMTADYLAFDSYFAKLPQSIGDQGEINSITVDEILNRAETSITSTTVSTSIVDKIQRNIGLANSFGMKICAYEGGQYLAAHDTVYVDNVTLTDKLTAANRHERMYDIYIKAFSAWFLNGGGLFMHFNLCELPSKYGNMGSLEWLDQPVSTAPKYRALTYVLNSTPSAPGSFSGTSTSSTTINWSWSSTQDAKYYYIYTSSSVNPSDWIARISSDTNSWLQQGLSPNTSSQLFIRTYSIFADTSVVLFGNIAYTRANPPLNSGFSVVSSSSITLSWNPNNNPDYTRYMIMASTDNFSQTLTILKNQNDNYTEIQYQHTGLTQGTTYYYRVRAFNNSGNSTSWDSIVSTCTLRLGNNPPEACASFEATDVWLSSITWSWADMSGNESGFYLKYSTSPSVPQFILQVSSDTTTVAEQSLSPNTLYCRCVSAYNNFGESSLSNSATAYTKANPPVFSYVSQVFISSITLIWAANSNPPYTRWGILRSSDNFASLQTLTNFISNHSSTAYTDTGLISNSTYWYRIQAFNEANAPTAFDIIISTLTMFSLIVDTSPPVAPPTTSVKNDLDRVLAYPNPYRSSDGYVKVNFINLTAQATIRIFNLTGDLVKTIEEVDGDGCSCWHGLSEDGEQMPSGIYLYAITNSKGEKKTGKVAIIK